MTILFEELQNLINKFFNSLNIQIIRLNEFENLRKKAQFYKYFEIFKDSKQNSNQIAELISKSKSQIGQDLFALVQNNFKQNGFFVEFGATNGIDLSNTYLLEKEFGWRGILAEPAKSWIENLRKNRNCCISSLCVWSTSGEKLRFSESINNRELSTVDKFKKNDKQRFLRRKNTSYLVETISLNDLLDSNGAPNEIDFLSIDTEGSEFEILKNLNFSKYTFNAICVEHNYTETRNAVFDLLSANGYSRVLEDVSEWDDWYIRN